jgi:spore cortex protein
MMKIQIRSGKMDCQKIRTRELVLTILVLVTFLIAGCANKGNQRSQQMTSPSATPQQSNPIRQQSVPSGNRVDIANQAADKVSRIPGVRAANILVTQRNAYVAAVLTDTNARLTRDIESKIADQVRSTDPTIQNVYVSTNPDFVNRVNTYVKDIQQGRPVAGFFEQFNELVRRIFPKAR